MWCQIPLRSRFFEAFLEENNNKVNPIKRKVKVPVVYYDDPKYQRARMKERRRRERVKAKKMDDTLSLGDTSVSTGSSLSRSTARKPGE